jgi:hypothetical protein
MLQRLLLASAFAAAAATQALAADPFYEPTPMAQQRVISGNVAFYTGIVWAHDYYELDDDDDYTPHGWVLGGGGRVNIWWTPSFTTQFDAWGDTTAFRYDSQEYAHGGFAVGAHASWRGGNHLIGGLISVGDKWGARWLNAAVEAQWHNGSNIVVTGQAGHTMSIVSYYDVSSYYGHVALKYFFHPNFYIEANGGVANEHDDDEADIIWRAALRAEYKHETMPVSVFGELQGLYWDYHVGHYTEHAVLVGARFFFNEPTLWASVTQGAGLVDYNLFTGVNPVRGAD